jgi:hypothetical protein
MSEQNCGNCDAFFANPDLKVKAGQPHQGWCRAKPPNLVQVMVQVASPLDPRGGQQMMPAWQGMFPPTSSNIWCREWKPSWAKNARVIEVEHEPATPATDSAA